MSSDFASRVSAQMAQMPSIQSKLGVFVARDGYRATVNIGPETVTLPFVGMYLPPTGHSVQLEMRDNQLVVTGPARPLPGMGKITGTGTPRATVTAWGTPYTLPFRSGYTPVLNDDVEIAWTGDGGIIQGKVTAVTVVVPPETSPGGGGGSFHPAPFTATGSGTFNPSYGKWISDDVYASSSTTGAWFYGSKVADTIPDGATVTTARIYLSPRSTSGAAPILQLHTSAWRPGGAVTFTGAGFALPARSGWVDIPIFMIDHLKVYGGGLGLNHGGYSIFRGTPADALSGALDIAWAA